MRSYMANDASNRGEQVTSGSTAGSPEVGRMQPQPGSAAQAGANGDCVAGKGSATMAVAGPQPPEPQELVPNKRSVRTWAVLLAVIVLIGTAGLLASHLARSATHPSTNDAYVEGRIVRISPRISGQVIGLHVDDNSCVRAGDPLLEIDPADYQAKVDQARAAVSIATSSIQQADAGVERAQAAIGEAEAALAAATADANRRNADWRRYQAVGTDGVSAQQLDAASTAAEMGLRQREAAEKKLTAASAEFDVARANVTTARSQLTAAEAQLRFAELQLRYTRVVAPEAGVVTKKNVEVGAFVSTAQPLMAIVPDDYWVVANFKEVQLERIRIGQPAAIAVDAFPGLRLRGRVDSVQAGTGARFQLLPPENATGNWVKVVQRVPVKITFERGQTGLERLAPGLSLEVEVDTLDPQPGIPAPCAAKEGR